MEEIKSKGLPLLPLASVLRVAESTSPKAVKAHA
jgi:hypothetical protein